jgi:hypothetical protein
MTNLKDKLSASVRQAKAAQQPVSKPAAKPAAPKAEPKPAASKPAAAKPAAAKEKTPGVPDSGSALFPDRVWPD